MRTLIGKEIDGFLEEIGVDAVYCESVKSIEEARKRLGNFSFPIILKISSKGQGNLNRAEGEEKFSVVKIARNREEFTKKFNELLDEARGKKVKYESVTMQEFVNGIELALSLQKDKTFGHVIMFGFGGAFFDTHKDVAYRACPINDRDAGRMIEDLRARKILMDGSKNLDLEKLRKALMKISKIPQKKRGLSEISINPLIMNEDGLKAVGAKISFD